MPRILDVNELRKEFGIKKLKRKIPITKAEIEAVNNLRKMEKRRGREGQ